MDNSSLANPISSFGNSFSTGFWSGGDWRWRWEGRWEGRRGWETDMDHSWNSAVYPEFHGLQPYKEQKLRKRLYMPISYSSLTVFDIDILVTWISKTKLALKEVWRSRYIRHQLIITCVDVLGRGPKKYIRDR